MIYLFMRRQNKKGETSIEFKAPFTRAKNSARHGKARHGTPKVWHRARAQTIYM